MNVRFWWRKCQTNTKSKVGILYAYVLVNGVKSTDFATSIRVSKSNWDSQAQRIIGNQLMTQEIENIKIALFRIKQKFEFEGKNYTSEDVKNFYLESAKGKGKKTFLECFSEYLEYLKIKRKWTKGTIKTQKTRFYNISQFFKNNNLEKLTPEQIKPLHLDNFFIENNKKAVDYVARHLEIIKGCIRYCILKEYITHSNLLEYHVEKENKTDKTSLSMYELKKLENSTFDSENLEKCKDIFLFLCYTGLNISDYFRFAKNPSLYLRKTANGSIFLVQDRQKLKSKTNKILATIPLIEKAQNILEKYKNELPVLADVTINKHLKTIGKELKLEGIKMRTKVGRKTFANYFWNSGIDSKAVSKMLGHTKLSTTQKYYVDANINFIEKEFIKIDFLDKKD